MSLMLPESLIDVWLVPLDETERIDPYCASLLDETQRLRLTKFTNPALSANYVQIQGKRRQILARYLGMDPAALKFGQGRYGKPYLINDAELAFNVTHSGSWFVVAVAWRCDLGIDIEVIKPRKGLQRLASRCFAEEELAYWRRLPDEQQLQAFYRLWTAKEALVKAVGRGLALGVEQCVIDTRQQLCWLRLPEQCAPAGQWRIETVDLRDHQVCCSLVHNKQQGTLNFRKWS